MLLLTTLMENSLDEGYARAAARRAARGGPASRPGPLLAAGLLAVGLLLATAAAQAHSRTDASDAARDALTAEIRDREAANARLERELGRSRAEASADRRAALRLTAQGAALSRQLGRLEIVTGAAAVAGPGMVVRLADARRAEGADSDPRAGDGSDDGRVTDRDLQTVVNEVWAAGAEAIAVNGQRLTSLSAIRAAGDAVLVDFRPLVPPYVVAAVGPPAMRASFVSGFGGSYLQVLRDYGIDYAVEDRARLRLPASGGLSLRAALTADGRTRDGIGSDPTSEKTEEESS